MGAIHFANAETFRRSVEQHLRAHHSPPVIHQLNGIPKAETADPLLGDIALPQPIKLLIIDCSAVSYIDLTGSKFLASLFSDLKSGGVSLVIAACSAHVIEQLDRCEVFHKFPRDALFPSLIDAVLSVQSGVSRTNHDSGPCV